VKFSVNHSTSFAIAMYGRDEVLKSAKLLEELGVFSCAALMDHLNWYPDYAKIYSAWIMATEVAIATKSLDVGILVSDVFRTHPVQAAQHALHLQQILGKNRHFIVGLGAGEGPNLQAWGIDASKPVSHLEEAIQVMKLVMSSHPRNKVSFDGKYYKFKKQFLQFPDFESSGLPRPRIWMAASSPRTLKITAKYADGWIPVGCTPALYKKQAEIVLGEGRDVELGYNTFISISKKDPDEAKKQASIAGSVFACRPEILEALGIEVPEKLDFIKHFSLPTISKHKRHQGNAVAFCQEHVPQEVVLDTVLAGSPDEIVGQIEKWMEAGCQHFGLQFLGKDYFESVKLFASDVIPHFSRTTG
ncbi:MAG: LLM class flavin-dependent oxidoreductase, partial [Promethearchaeota archaeon]